MPRRIWIPALGLWPGLPQIWTGQEILGLLLACFFAATLNLAMVCRFVWVDLLGSQGAAFMTALAGGTWAVAMLYSILWTWRCHPDRHKTEIESLFRDALDHYLQGRWNEARRRLEQILSLDENDADALMQLGTLYLRTGQQSQARRAFRQCLELEGGGKWRWEIQQSLNKLDSQ